MEFGPGVYDISNTDYHQSAGISRSTLALILRSPAHFAAGNKLGREPSKALTDGTAIHCAVLEPELFTKLYAKVPDGIELTSTGRIGKAAKEQLAALTKDNPQLSFLDEETWDMVMGISQSVRKHSVAMQYLVGGAAEKSVFWRDPDTRILCKCRPDYWKPGLVVDLKSTQSAHHDDFIDSIIRYGYTLQAAYYMDGTGVAPAKSQSEDPDRGFKFIAVEKTSPFAVNVFNVTPQMYSVGRTQYKEALYRLSACQATNEWPAYPDIEWDIELPNWYVQRHMPVIEIKTA